MMSSILLIEAFYSGSHSQLIDTLENGLGGCIKYTLPGKKWHWRARTAALYFSQEIVPSHEYRILFTSSVLNLAELIALRPDLFKLKKIVYFHENQLVYPVRKQQDRDFQYGYNQIITCLAADVVLFNSQYNMDSFLSSIGTFLKLMPDFRPKDLAEKIRPKCQVLYFPIDFPQLKTENSAMLQDGKESSTTIDTLETCNLTEQNDSLQKKMETLGMSSQISASGVFDCNNVKLNLDEALHQPELMIPIEHRHFCQKDLNSTSSLNEECTDVCDPSADEIRTFNSSSISHQTSPLKIIWAHRWEHDKNPELFFSTLYKLHESGESFRISVLGENFSEIPDIFKEAYEQLKDYILHWGYLKSKEEYFKVLIEGDIAVSTANHEFYGVAMLEAVHCGCFPLCPNRLVYPEIFPKDCLYNTDQQLFKQLRRFCRKPTLVRNYNRSRLNAITSKCSWTALKDHYINLFTIN
ncbi:glycosyltransferase-like domain-containing protein 1 [Anneissia japonica]|uniref:glycosyltransferase-like domain-containing protein 1 n=1 Tax=Anneissia japonica TaxID=1529436 RepID=UPI0014259BBB|nr:glycosyltransferase-like domain-containing protein 1 [Anneissia japonica]XP_033127147.1 glycosyltransferase-like domain-containing protein 1 [Anneissia japonica]XP_033127155.1 glycosyltransferase-like domain-containing protein 1 [Anneissia japonica]XP_033127162.1 glycosyltransferase-like domain-containing protein 1 [Anneissia japonica]XP_033127170.1 glycosyltransferase-like domain-containing protein 1 [Anneissia japonica]